MFDLVICVFQNKLFSDIELMEIGYFLYFSITLNRLGLESFSSAQTFVSLKTNSFLTEMILGN